MDSIYDLLELFIFDSCEKIIFCDIDNNASETAYDDESDAKDYASELDNSDKYLASFEVDANRNALVINYGNRD